MARVIGIGERVEPKFGLIEQDQMAAQVVAILDAHFKRPNADEKLEILKAARQQVEATRLP
jgi:hypothetical protein